MRRWAGLVLVVVLALLAFLALRETAGPADGAPSAASGGTTAAEAAPHGRVAVPPPSGAVVTESAAIPAPGVPAPDPSKITDPAILIARRTLRGRVVDVRGAPVAGARVIVESRSVALGWWWRDRGEEPTGTTATSARSAEDGRFGAEYLEGAEVWAFSWIGSERSVTRRIDLPGEECVLVVPDGEPTLRGVVRTRDGAPVPAARVRATSSSVRDVGSGFDVGWPGRTGSDGAYRIQGRPAGTWFVHVAADGYATARRRAVDVPPAGATLDVELVPGIDLPGRVVDAVSGSGVAGAHVRQWPHVDGEAWTTDRDGRFVATALDGTKWIELLADAEGYVRGDVEVSPDGERPAEVEIRLVRPASVRLRCVDAGARPVAGVVAALTSHQRLDEEHETTSRDVLRSGADGVVLFPSVAAGAREVTLDLHLGGVRVARREVAVPAPGDVVDLGDVAVDLGRTLTGRVLRADGTPARGVHVFAVPSVPGGDPRYALGSAGLDPHEAWTSETDDDGAFAVQGLAPGLWDLGAWHDRGKDPPVVRFGVTVPAAGDVAPLVLRIPPRRALTGRLVDPQGRPLAGWSVSALIDDPLPLNLSVAAKTDADGRFAFEDRFSEEATRVWVEAEIAPGYDDSDLEETGLIGAYVDVRTCPVTLRLDRLRCFDPDAHEAGR